MKEKVSGTEGSPQISVSTKRGHTSGKTNRSVQFGMSYPLALSILNFDAGVWLIPSTKPVEFAMKVPGSIT